MVGVKEAVQKSAEFATEVLGADRAHDLRVEEVELDEANRRWMVTLSMPSLDAANFLSPEFAKRDYRAFTVNADSGVVLAMRIRELTGAV